MLQACQPSQVHRQTQQQVTFSHTIFWGNKHYIMNQSIVKSIQTISSLISHKGSVYSFNGLKTVKLYSTTKSNTTKHMLALGLKRIGKSKTFLKYSFNRF